MNRLEMEINASSSDNILAEGFDLLGKILGACLGPVSKPVSKIFCGVDSSVESFPIGTTLKDVQRIYRERYEKEVKNA